MNTVNKLLDKAREVCSSDAEIARRLGVTRSAVSVWRKGGTVTPAHLAKLITLTQQDPAIAVQVLAEQDATPEERAMWGVVWDRLSPVTSMVAGVLLAVGLALPFPSQASLIDANLNNGPFVHYAKLRRWLAKALSWWRDEPSTVLA